MESNLVSLPGQAGAQAEDLAEKSIRLGVNTLADVAQSALTRLLAIGTGMVFGEHFLSNDEKETLADAFASVLGTAELLGRARVRDLWLKALKSRGIISDVVTEARLPKLLLEVTPMPPERAVRYFSSLMPELGQDPQRYGPDLRRQAFTMAVATDRQLLGSVQDIIRGRLQSGENVGSGPQDVQQILTDAGVSHRNPQYAELVFRTNVKDALQTGAYQEFRDPDVQATFPVWQYSNPNDTRSRPEHADRNGKYYPADVPFVQVRGTDIEDAANCRCDFIPIDKWTWDELKGSGARIADGYPDVPSLSEFAAKQPKEEPNGEEAEWEPSYGPLQNLSDNLRTVSYQQIDLEVERTIRSLSAKDAIKLADDIGVFGMRSRKQAAAEIATAFKNRKGTFGRTSYGSEDKPWPEQPTPPAQPIAEPPPQPRRPTPDLPKLSDLPPEIEKKPMPTGAPASVVRAIATDLENYTFGQIDAAMKQLETLTANELAAVGKKIGVLAGRTKAATIKDIRSTLRNSKANIGRTSYDTHGV